MSAQTLEETHSGSSPQAAASPLKNGATPHKLTAEDRQRGAAVTNAKRAKQKEAAAQLVVRELASKMRPLVKEHLEIALADDSGGTRLAAIKEAYDRVLGKPTQSVEHSGPGGGAIVTEHREKLTLEAAVELVAKRRQASTITETSVPTGRPELPAGPSK